MSSRVCSSSVSTYEYVNLIPPRVCSTPVPPRLQRALTCSVTSSCWNQRGKLVNRTGVLLPDKVSYTLLNVSFSLLPSKRSSRLDLNKRKSQIVSQLLLADLVHRVIKTGTVKIARSRCRSCIFVPPESFIASAFLHTSFRFGANFVR